MQVLIVEDCPQTRSLLRHVLTEAGFDVVEAENGDAAWECLRTGTVRLAIVDSQTSGVDGIDLCRRLSDSPQTTGVYVIMLTSSWESEAMVQALDSGASDYLAKPFKPGELVARVRVGSRLVELQAQLSQAQKLESIGQLAAGIAHEINTPIQYIGDNLQFLSDSLADLLPWMKEIHDQHDSQVRMPNDWEYLSEELPVATNQSLQGIRQVARIVSAMKGFSHMGAKEFRAVDLRDVIDDAKEVSRNQWKYVSDVEIQFPENWPSIYCLRGEINQVFLNLIINAAHAIEDSYRQSGGDKGTISVRGSLDQDQVRIDISDTGSGIPQEIQNRIFDPFFTTKEVGKGTGQGLAMVHSIVNQHHGQVSFETTIGQGTTFSVWLPIEHNRPDSAEEGSPSREATQDNAWSNLNQILSATPSPTTN